MKDLKCQIISIHRFIQIKENAGNYEKNVNLAAKNMFGCFKFIKGSPCFFNSKRDRVFYLFVLNLSKGVCVLNSKGVRVLLVFKG